MEAIARYFGSRAHVEGTDSGLHVVVWLRDIPRSAELQIVANAKAHGVGIWPVSPLYAEGQRYRKQRCAGFVLGYASLKEADIDKGIQLLAAVLPEADVDRRRPRR